MSKTFEQIMDDMLERVPNTIDKREGSIIYDALAPAAIELAQMYAYLDWLDLVTYADEATDEYLTRRCAERGVNRKPATYSKRKGEFNTNIPIGSRFAIEDVTYIVSELLDGTNYVLTCEQIGPVGNLYSGELTPLNSIQNLSLAILSDILIPAEDVEDDESLRARYFESLSSEAYGGNQRDYKLKVEAIDGVGGVRVFPAWNGGGTVKLVITDSNHNKPSQTLIDTVQMIMDPPLETGLGTGVAPIGHKVTVASVNEIPVNITTSLTFTPGRTWADVQPLLLAAYENYLSGIREKWNSEPGVVRIAYLDTIALSIAGIVDVTGTKINGKAYNLLLGDVEIPILGKVTNL